jgi:hypothetical protein
LLKNPFYKGQFWWEKKLHPGTHTPLVLIELFAQVQAVFQGHNKPRLSAREFAYRGLLTCAYDNCKVTAEIKKEKYTYYRCTGFRGKCELPYFREQELGDRLGQILKNIYIPDDILDRLQDSLVNDKGHQEELRRQQGERLAQRLTQVHRRMDLAYQDKLDGKISEEFWSRKSMEWQLEESQIRGSLVELQRVRTERFLDVVKDFRTRKQGLFSIRYARSR